MNAKRRLSTAVAALLLALLAGGAALADGPNGNVRYQFRGHLTSASPA